MNINNNFIVTSNNLNYYNTSPKKLAFQAQNNKITKLIQGQENCWRLHKEDVFEEFLKSDSELIQQASSFIEVLRKYGLPICIDNVLHFKEKFTDLKKLIETIKNKYDIDITVPPTIYRFIGTEEIKKLKSGEKVIPQRFNKEFDVTINPELNWNIFRIAFKPKQKFSILDKNSLLKENPGCNHDYFYHLKDSYSLDDIEKIEQISK